MAQLNNLTCFRGEAPVFNFTMSPLVNLTGVPIVFTVRKRNDATQPTLISVNGVVTNGPAGQFSITVTHPQTMQATLPAGMYAYDVWRTDAGNEAVLSYGSFKVDPEVLY